MRTQQLWPFGRRRRRNLWAGIASGMVGGLAASWVMGQYMTLAQRAQKAIQQRRLSQGGNGHELPGDRGLAEDRQARGGQGEQPANVKAAAVVSERVFRHRLSQREERIAGPAVHYTFGTLMGGLYGGLAEVQPRVKAGAGMAFGAALFVGADEVAVPALRLAPPPRQVPASLHANALVAHLIWGGTTEGIRAVMRRMF